jgi:hypothetical protein
MNYNVRDQEGLALVDTFKKFSHYIRGSKFTCICNTDHESLKYLNNGKPLEGRLGRWQEYLNGYDYSIVPIKGPTNLIADGISRSITLHTAKAAIVVASRVCGKGLIIGKMGDIHRSICALFLKKGSMISQLVCTRARHATNLSVKAL